MNMKNKRDIESSEFFATRGMINLGFDNYPLAFEDFERSIKLNSKNENAYHNRGIAFMSFGKIEIAINDFEKTLKLNSQLISVFFSLGLAYYKLGDYEKSIEFYEKYLRYDKNKSGDSEDVKRRIMEMQDGIY